MNEGILKVTVHDRAGQKAPIKGAVILVSVAGTTGAVPNKETKAKVETDASGQALFQLEPGYYSVAVETFRRVKARDAKVEADKDLSLDFPISIGFELDVDPNADDLIPSGTPIRVSLLTNEIKSDDDFRTGVEFRFTSTCGSVTMTDKRKGSVDTTGLTGAITLSATLSEVNTSSMTVTRTVKLTPPAAQPVSDDLFINLNRADTVRTTDEPLWTVIRAGSAALSFNNYKTFIDAVMCGREPFSDPGTDIDCSKRSLPFPGVAAYSLLKCATEIFLMTHCGVALEDFGSLALNLTQEKARYGQDITQNELNQLWDAYLLEVNGGNPVKTLPFLALIRSHVGGVPIKDSLSSGVAQAEIANCFGILRNKLARPCLIELIWSYWHEEGMLVQTMQAISMRFQNKRDSAAVEPLRRFDIDPLRPLNNLLWGYIRDEQHRLTILRRAYEYDHQYGIPLQNRAVPALRPVEGRSKFLEAFHNLLHLSSVFFKEDGDTTVHADAFPVMNAIREVHLLLAEGAHNQYGDLPSTARQEMLIEQWLLAQPEMREFLGGRRMVPYPEPWMDRVDTVKEIQGWTDITISDFNNLAVFGERLLLSVRHGHWTSVHDPAQAAHWARYWRPEIQGYIHSYRSLTGVNFTQEPNEYCDPPDLLG